MGGTLAKGGKDTEMIIQADAIQTGDNCSISMTVNNFNIDVKSLVAGQLESKDEVIRALRNENELLHSVIRQLQASGEQSR
ncbi:MAG: hypothetical protein LBQ74_05055 [Prevotella sp.]|jgi:hypothetical protein|nr:hypothetical protein [Prevotella sp.]